MAFWLVGLALLIWAASSVDVSKVFNLILKMKWGLPLILSIYILINLADAVSWKYALKPLEAKPVTIWGMWRIRQIGEAFNMVTPLGTMGGEPVKAQLLKETYGLDMKQTISSLVVSRTTNLLGLVTFLIIGTALVWSSPDIAPAFKNTGLVGLTIFSTLILLFLFFQIHSGLKTIVNWFTTLPFRNSIQRLMEHLETLSHHMADYYHENSSRCLKSIWYSFVGWTLGILELYLTMYFLGYKLSLIDAWIIEALVQLIKVGSFFIPLSLGALESGTIFIFAAIGISANLALATSVVRRIKELTWIALGLGMSSSIALKSSKLKIE